MNGPKWKNRAKYSALRNANNSDLGDTLPAAPQQELDIVEDNENCILKEVSMSQDLNHNIVPEISLFNEPEPEPANVEEKPKPKRKVRKPTTRKRTTRKKATKKEVA